MKEWQIDAIKLDATNIMSGAEIGAKLGVSKSAINRFLAKYHQFRNETRVDDMYQEANITMHTYNNERILIISDMHIPYHHPNLLNFLQMLKDRYNPTRVICIGDELDKHAMSFHDSDPDLLSAGDELRLSLPIIAAIYKMFPVMDIIDSNHGSMVHRKAKHHGIPRAYIKTYNDVLEVGPGWKWHNDLTVILPNGDSVYFHHGKSADGLKLSQAMGMSCVQGHYHEKFGINYWANSLGRYWSMQVGCLIDDDNYAFAYNNVNLKRPMIGTGLIIDSIPVLEAMDL
jgi:hypothetical protein